MFQLEMNQISGKDNKRSVPADKTCYRIIRKVQLSENNIFWLADAIHSVRFLFS